jgi:serralysin
MKARRIIAIESEWMAIQEIAQIASDAFSLDPYVGLTFRDKPILALDGVIDHLDQGTEISAPNDVITYSFVDSDQLVGLFLNPLYSFPDVVQLTPFTEAQRSEARDSIRLWGDLIPQSFVETKGRGADIQFVNVVTPSFGPGTAAYAFYPAPHGFKYGSDVFVIDPALYWQNAWLGFGGFGATVLLHELGHSLGFSHPSDYTAVPNVPFSYANYAEYAQDSMQYTVMSYFGPEETGGLLIDWSIFLFNWPQTPLVHDILAIQSKYGVDLTTRAGDTVYGWNSTAGNVIYDFSQNLFPYLSIYDAGGNDTIDMSGANASVFIDLAPGSFSSAAADFPTADYINARAQAELGGTGIPGGVPTLTQTVVDLTEQFIRDLCASLLAPETGVAGLRATTKDNISIAYNTIIENAVGSNDRDLLLGNDASNLLSGLAGDDVLDGRVGADTLLGGAGADIFRLWSIEKGDTIADFESDIDKLDLSGIGVDFTFVGSAAFTGSAGELRFADGQLQGDTNGDLIADLLVTINGDPIVLSDLILA